MNMQILNWRITHKVIQLNSYLTTARLVRILIATLLITLSTITLQAKDSKDKITVLQDNVENIKIDINSGYFVAVELENEIQGFIQLSLQGVQAQKLNNKTIVIFTYNDNLPKKLGKIIING